MAETPQYVRLANRLSRGIVADIDGGSGWSIAGLDVRAFPDKKKNPGAARFVKKALADGRLEPASLAEWEEVHDTEAIEAEALEGRKRATALNSQEAHIQREAQEGRKRIEASRRAADGEDDDEDEDVDLDAPVRKKSAKAKKNKGKKAKGETVGDGTDVDNPEDENQE